MSALNMPLTIVEPGTHHTIRMTIDLVDGRYAVTSVQLTAARGETITGEDLRRVVVVGALRDVINRIEGDAPTTKPDRFPDDGPTDENLRYIAAVYHHAYVRRLAPTLAVAALGLTYSTAARWVVLARAAGHITVKPSTA